MVSPYINHFVQPDTIVPNLYNPQSWNRYSYTNNNPINLVDPSGHDGTPPAGNQIQINISLGINIGPLFLTYYSLSFVTDHGGGAQLYFTKRDQDFNEGSGFEAGASEKANPTSMFSLGGASVTWGAIDGSDFRQRGTEAMQGKAASAVFSVGSFSSDAYAYADPETGKIDPSMLSGFDIGVGYGGPVTYGNISTTSIPLTPRIQMPGWFIPVCKLAIQCGSAGPDNPMMKPPPVPKNPPEITTPTLTTPGINYPRSPGKSYPHLTEKLLNFLK
jgi:hypothetical protein